MRLLKIGLGHWEDGDHKRGFQRRNDFANYCIGNAQAAIGFTPKDKNPFDTEILAPTQEVMEEITEDELAEAYIDAGMDPDRAEDNAQQIVTFRDMPNNTPVWGYLGDNTVYGLGYLAGNYRFEWNGESMEKFGYPHIRPVNWVEMPRRFSRHQFLPEDLRNWVAAPRTISVKSVEPDSETQRFLRLAYGIAESMQGLPDSDVKTGLK